MEKQKPFYWDFIKKDADLTFSLGFRFCKLQRFHFVYAGMPI